MQISQVENVCSGTRRHEGQRRGDGGDGGKGFRGERTLEVGFERGVGVPQVGEALGISASCARAGDGCGSPTGGTSPPVPELVWAT